MDTDTEPADPAIPDANPYRHLFEHVQDAIVDFQLVDDEPIVRSVNDAFADLFGYDPDAVRGESLNDLIVPSWLVGESDRFDRRTARGRRNRAVVDRQTDDGVKTLLYRGIPYDDGQRGFAIYTDLTDEMGQERQLAVLNRLIRHRLRDEVTVITGQVEHLLEDLAVDLELAPDSEHREAAELIRESALALDRLGEEARDVERVLEADPELEPTDLGAAVAAAREAVPLMERAGLTVDVADVPRVLTGGHLDRVLAALLDNAVRHSDTVSPRVSVVAVERADRVAVTVLDDGPGLPEHERRLLTREMDPTPLDHGNGLGLWLVRWIVTSYGGAVDYDEPRGGGSAITLELDAA